MCVTIRNSMHGVLLLPPLKKQRELVQGPINLIIKNQRWKDTVVEFNLKTTPRIENKFFKNFALLMTVLFKQSVYDNWLNSCINCTLYFFVIGNGRCTNQSSTQPATYHHKSHVSSGNGNPSRVEITFKTRNAGSHTTAVLSPTATTPRREKRQNSKCRGVTSYMHFMQRQEVFLT